MGFVFIGVNVPYVITGFVVPGHKTWERGNLCGAEGRAVDVQLLLELAYKSETLQAELIQRVKA
jgi:hypothetical protein